MTKDERKTENDSGQWDKGGYSIAVEYEQADEYDDDNCYTDQDRIELRDDGVDVLFVQGQELML